MADQFALQEALNRKAALQAATITLARKMATERSAGLKASGSAGSSSGVAGSASLEGAAGLLDPDTLRTLTLTVLGEAAGEGKRGQTAVAWVIRNRATSGDKAFPDTPAEVALQKNSAGIHQFSTWNDKKYGGNSPAVRYPATGSTYQQVAKIVQKVMAGEVPDPTDGSKFYISTSIAHPGWFDKVSTGGLKVIGGHVFALPSSGVQSNAALSAIAQIAPSEISKIDLLGFATAGLAITVPTQSTMAAAAVNNLRAKVGVSASYGSKITDKNQVVAAAKATDRSTVRVISVHPDGTPVSDSGLVSHQVTTLRIDPMTNQVIVEKPAAVVPKSSVSAKANDRDVVNPPPPKVTFTTSKEGPPLTDFQKANLAWLMGSDKPASEPQYGKRDPMSVFFTPPPVPKNATGAKAQDRDGSVEYGYNARTGNYEAKVPGEPYVAGPDRLKSNDNKSQERLPNGSSIIVPLMPASPISAKVSSLVATVPGYKVPKYVDLVSKKQIPMSQPIEQGEGVHWDSDVGQYVIDSPKPTPPTTYRTVTTTKRVLNPDYDPDKAAAAAAAQEAARQQKIAVQRRDPAVLAQMRSAQLEAQRAAINDAYVRAQAAARAGALSKAQVQATAAALVKTGLQSPEAAQAIASGNSSYTTSYGAQLPTVAMNGKVRNTYGDEANGLGKGYGQ